MRRPPETPMPLGYWCLLIAGLALLRARWSPNWASLRQPPPARGAGARAGHRKRANWAQATAFESLPLFIAAVLVASPQHADAGKIDNAALCLCWRAWRTGCFTLPTWLGRARWPGYWASAA